jgi:very-short-patch-repair endonuclease
MPNQNARSLRSNLTDAERALWQRIRHRQVEDHRFRRQVPIGPYIVDFACLEVRLIIEVDGGQHDLAAEHDRLRDMWLAERGYRVLRFWNNEVLTNIDGVLDTLTEQLRHTPHPTLPLKGGGE